MSWSNKCRIRTNSRCIILDIRHRPNKTKGRFIFCLNKSILVVNAYRWRTTSQANSDIVCASLETAHLPCNTAPCKYRHPVVGDQFSRGRSCQQVSAFARKLGARSVIFPYPYFISFSIRACVLNMHIPYFWTRSKSYFLYNLDWSARWKCGVWRRCMSGTFRWRLRYWANHGWV